MYERFTDRARKVMLLATQQAQELNHEFIGGEHILLGLVKEGSGIAANVLKNFDVDRKKIRSEVLKEVTVGPKFFPGRRPLSAEGTRIIEGAKAEAVKLGHNYHGTEHVLLGLISVEDGVASKVLATLGVSLEKTRQEVADFITTEPSRWHPLVNWKLSDEQLLRLMAKQLVPLRDTLSKLKLTEEQQSQLPTMLKKMIDDIFRDGSTGSSSSRTN